MSNDFDLERTRPIGARQGRAAADVLNRPHSAAADPLAQSARQSAQRQLIQAVFSGSTGRTDDSTVVQRTEDRWIRGRLVSGAEQDRDALADEYYATWGFVERLKDKNASPQSYSYPKQDLQPAWALAWDAFDQRYELEVQNWIASNRTDFSAFARGQPLWGLRNTVLAAGGLLTRGALGPGPIPLITHPDETVVTLFIARAHAAYLLWLPNPILDSRGPFDPVHLTAGQLTALKKRPAHMRGPGWTSHPSDSARWALHHVGPYNAEVDPKTELPCTFIYHVG